MSNDIQLRELLDIFDLIPDMESDDTLTIDRVIFDEDNGATIVFWKDYSKTVVVTQNGEKFDKEKGLALCFMKKIHGNKGSYNDLFRKYCK